MEANEIRKLCVVGAGAMGHQIAVCAALAGYDTACCDVSREALNKAGEFADTYLEGRTAKGKLSEEEAKGARSRLFFTERMEQAAGDADFVIEAATERIALKRKLFSELDRIAPPHTVLATNSSFLVSSKVADATSRPDKVCNMHFFNPALVMKLVEVVKGPHTSMETAEAAMALAQQMGKQAVMLQKEVYGFLVNRILNAINREAFFLADMGVAAPEEIDLAVEAGLNHPMGPFRLMDLTGIDMNYYQRLERYQETQDPSEIPWPLLTEKWAKGEWGKKTGKGFYDYE